MNIINAGKQIFRIVRRTTFPNAYEKTILKWWSDGGDEAFRYNYELNSSSFVMDLGGYKGQWASDIFARYQCRIAIFEPVPAYASSIKKKIRSK